jgi:hypothetical protein
MRNILPGQRPTDRDTGNGARCENYGPGLPDKREADFLFDRLEQHLDRLDEEQMKHLLFFGLASSLIQLLEVEVTK